MATLRTPSDRGVSFLVLPMLFLSPRLVQGASKKCFSGSGDQTNQLPCYPDSQDDNICCEAGDICLSNGLCKYGPNAAKNESIEVDTYRPDCTDQGWSSENCFSGCNNFKESLVQSCYDNRYCCYGSNGCDCSKTSLFEFDAATFVTTLPSSSATATSEPASNPATTTSTSATDSAATTVHNPSSTSSPSSSSNVGVAAGVGVGVGLAAAILGAAAIYLYKRKRRSHNMTQLASNRGSPTYTKGHSMPLSEVHGHSIPQEMGYKEPPQELDGGAPMKIRHA